MRTSTRIRRFIEEELLDGLAPSGDPLAQRLLDSLAIERLVAFMEYAFDITFDDVDLVAENFESIASVTALVRAKRRSSR